MEHVRTVENVHGAPKAQIGSEGSGGMPPSKKLLLFRARKCHFPRFPGNSFINQSMTKRRVFSNLSFICQPFIDRRFNDRLNTELNLQAKGETSPENSNPTLSMSMFLCL